MSLVRGRVVFSKAGRDKDNLFAVLESADGYAMIADGKLHALASPKRKNERHLRLTNTVLEESVFKTDKQLKQAIASYARTAIPQT